MDKALERIVDLCVKSLKQENDFLQTSIAKNTSAYPNGGPALLKINNERYYQFVVSRGLIAEFELPIELEKGTHDLVAYSRDGATEIIVEMKRWMSSQGESEINGIRLDIEQKLKPANSKKALMLVYSANPPDVSIEENVKWLSNKLGIVYAQQDWHWGSFETTTIDGKKAVFWIAGYQVK